MAQPVSPSYEVGIFGAGPIRIELAVALKRLGMKYIHFDTRHISHTISWWQEGTSFFSLLKSEYRKVIQIESNRNLAFTKFLRIIQHFIKKDTP